MSTRSTSAANPLWARWGSSSSPVRCHQCHSSSGGTLTEGGTARVTLRCSPAFGGTGTGSRSRKEELHHLRKVGRDTEENGSEDGDERDIQGRGGAPRGCRQPRSRPRGAGRQVVHAPLRRVE